MDFVMIGGMLLLGYVVVQNIGTISQMIPSFPQYQTVYADEDDEAEDYEDESGNLECNEDGSKCKYCDYAPDPRDCNDTEEVCGSAVKTNDDNEERVLRRAYEKWEEKYDDRYNQCHRKSGGGGSPPKQNTKIVKTITDNFPPPPSSKTVSDLKKQLGMTTSSRPPPKKPAPRSGGCSITATDCAVANKNMKCKLVYNGNRCSCQCPKSNHVTILRHGHNRLNIPKAYVTNAYRPAMNMHLNYV